MNAGLPSSGIGGIFYLLSAFLMVGVEVVVTVRGKSSRRRWNLVMRQVSMSLSILGIFFLTGWVLSHFIVKRMTVRGIERVITTSWVDYATPFLLLAGLILLTQILRVIYRVRDSII